MGHCEQHCIVSFCQIKDAVGRVHAHLGYLDVHLAGRETPVSESAAVGAQSVCRIGLVAVHAHEKNIGIRDGIVGLACH